MNEGILNGYRALDLTEEKGHVCGKILSTMGIETIKIEPPGGDPDRMLPSQPDEVQEEKLDLRWMVNNGNKLGITLNVNTGQGKELFLRLVKKSDFILESFTPGHLDSLGIGFKDLSKINPALIMTSISLFGQKGPYSRYKGGELVASAMGGALINNGYTDRPPVKEALDANIYHANVVAVLGTIMAHYHYQKTGQGQQVDIAVQEVTASRNFTGKILYQFDKKLLHRSGDRHHMGIHTARWIWKLKDGYAWFNLMGGKIGAPANQALSDWIDDDGLDNPLKIIKDWKEFDRSTLDPEIRSRFETAIEKFFLGHTKKEIEEEGLKRGIRACVANTPADLLENPQLVARDYWVKLPGDKEQSSYMYPKLFFQSSETENYVTRETPYPGQHNQQIYSDLLGLSEKEMGDLKKANII